MNAKARGLGKGLGALIPSNDTVYREMPVSQIEVNPLQPRRTFDADALKSLTESVKMVGVLQPIVVRSTGTADRFQIIAGERRWRASKKAGLSTIPVIIKDSDDETSLTTAIIENAHREDLNPLEEASAFQQLIDDFDFTHAQVGERLGKSRAAITNALRLLGLPPRVQQKLAAGSLSAGHARALLGTEDQDLQETLAAQAVEHDWSVRATETAVRAASNPEPNDLDQGKATKPTTGKNSANGKKPSTGGNNTALLETATLLEDLLSTQVKISAKGGSGQIQIRFADQQDLTRIAKILGI